MTKKMCPISREQCYEHDDEQDVTCMFANDGADSVCLFEHALYGLGYLMSNIAVTRDGGLCVHVEGGGINTYEQN